MNINIIFFVLIGFSSGIFLYDIFNYRQLIILWIGSEKMKEQRVLKRKMYFLKAVGTIAVVLALILPGASAFTHTGTTLYTENTMNNIISNNQGSSGLPNAPMTSITTTANRQTSGVSVTDWWPMFRHDLTHTGFSTSTGPTTNHTLWRFPFGGIGHSSPIVYNGKVYWGTGDNTNAGLYCFDAVTGEVLWIFSVGIAIQAVPTIINGIVYVGACDGRMYCLNADTGKEIWDHMIGAMIYSSAAVVDGKVYFGAENNAIYCLNATTGDIIWQYMTSSSVYSSPAAANGKIYIGSTDGFLYCLDANSGSLVWKFLTNNWIFFCSPTVADGKVYVGSWDNNFYCLNANTGNLIWSYATNDRIWGGSPAIAYGKVYFGSLDRYVYCLDATTGNLTWKFQTGDQITSSPAVADGKVYIGSNDMNVYCFNATTGTVVWKYRTGGAVYSAPAIAAGRVYVYSDDWWLYCFGAPSPVFDISVKGGLGVTATVKNVGDAKATNVNVTIKMVGGFILSGKEKTVNVPWITTGAVKDVKSMVFGLGKTVITVTVTCAEGMTAEKTAKGCVLLFFARVGCC
jgi:outer membrane protein assembly factor BamB